MIKGKILQATVWDKIFDMQNRVISSYKESQDYTDSEVRNFQNAKKNILSLCNLGLRQSKYKENDLVQKQVSPNMARTKSQMTPIF